MASQGTDASSDHGSAPPAPGVTVTALSPGENSNSGPCAGVPVVAEEDAGKGKDVVVEYGSAGSGHSDARVLPKGKRSAAEALAREFEDAASGRKKLMSSHIFTERERRKRMRNMFAELKALLPDVPEKADKATIIGEAISFIKVLEGNVTNLQKRKQDLVLARLAAAAVVNHVAATSAPPPPGTPLAAAASSDDLPRGWAWLPKQQEQKPAASPVGFQSWCGTNVVLSVSKDDALISVSAPNHPGLLVLLMSVLLKHRLDVLTAHVESDGDRRLYSFHARVNAEAVRMLDGEPPAPEDIYKLAVSEIIIWLST